MRRVSAQPGLLLLRVSPLCLAFIAVACGAPAPPAPRAAPRASAPVPSFVPWPRFVEARSWPPVGAPFANNGHPGAGAVAVVRVSPEARGSYERLVRDSALPDGAVVALFHREAADGRPGPVYVMEKSGTSWRYLALRPDGTLPESAPEAARRAGERCARCHADGVADALFGLPRAGGRQP